jgi:hypothetical protein
MTMAERHYYVVDPWVARVRDALVAELLPLDGTWKPYDDVWKVRSDGRYVPTEAEAIQEAREMFEMSGVQHKL